MGQKRKNVAHEEMKMKSNGEGKSVYRAHSHSRTRKHRNCFYFFLRSWSTELGIPFICFIIMAPSLLNGPYDDCEKAHTLTLTHIVHRQSTFLRFDCDDAVFVRFACNRYYDVRHTESPRNGRAHKKIEPHSAADVVGMQQQLMEMLLIKTYTNTLVATDNRNCFYLVARTMESIFVRIWVEHGRMIHTHRHSASYLLLPIIIGNQVKYPVCLLVIGLLVIIECHGPVEESNSRCTRAPMENERKRTGELIDKSEPFNAGQPFELFIVHPFVLSISSRSANSAITSHKRSMLCPISSAYNTLLLHQIVDM